MYRSILTIGDKTTGTDCPTLKEAIEKMFDDFQTAAGGEDIPTVNMTVKAGIRRMSDQKLLMRVTFEWQGAAIDKSELPKKD